MDARRATATCCLTLLSIVAIHAQSGVIELNEAGWKALRDGRSDRSAALFAEALTLRPDDPVLLLGAGSAAHAQGKQRDALTRLQRALVLDPRLIVASKLLGQIAYEEG